MNLRSIRSWIDTQACEPEPVLYADADADQAADRAALLEELTRVEHELEALGEYREQLREDWDVYGRWRRAL